MNKLYLWLSRLAVWLDSERITAAGSAYYGLHLLFFRSFAGNSAFSFYAVPEIVFALPLLLGASLQIWGIWRHDALHLLLGALSGFFVFVSAFISCVIAAPMGTGVPAYLLLSMLYLALALRRATGKEYTFNP